MASQATLRWWPKIQQYARQYGLDPTLMLGVVDFESGGNEKIRNKSSGATGLGQVMPREAGFPDRPTVEQLQDPDTNLLWTARILKSGLDRYGSEDKALAAYLGAIDKNGNITGAKDANGTGGNQYIQTVRARQKELRGQVGATIATDLESASPAPDYTASTAGTRAPLPPVGNIPSPSGRRRPASAESLAAVNGASNGGTPGRRQPSARALAAVARSDAEFANMRRAMGNTAIDAAPELPEGVRPAFTGTYVSPVDGPITNPYGGVQAYSAGKKTDIGSVNRGADRAAPAGTVVRAPVGGTILEVAPTKLDDRKGERDADENTGWGGYIVIKGDDGYTHRLSHAQYGSIVVKPGQRVEAGQPTHQVGVSGNSTGPHVDWEKHSGATTKGATVDPYAAPIVPSAQGAKVYQEALARAKQATNYSPDNTGAAPAPSASPTTGGTASPAAGDAAGGSSVSQTAGTGAAANSPAVAYYTQQKTAYEAKLAAARRTRDEYQREVAGLEYRIADTKKANPNAPTGDLQRRLDEYKAKGGLLEQATDEITALESDVFKIGENLAQAQTVAQKAAEGKTLTPQEQAHYEAETDNLKARTEELRRQAQTGGVSAAQQAQIQAQIANNEAELAIRGAEQDRLNRESPSRIRATNAQAGQAEWAVSEGRATLPFNIDRIIASTDVDTVTAQKLREMLPYELDKISEEVYRLQQLTPIEIEQGKADVDLTRQRASEISKLIGPRVQQVLAATGVDVANANRIMQMLPYDIASSKAEIALRGAQTGLTNAQARKAQVDADVAQRKEQGWRQYVEWAQANPNASEDQRNGVLMGLVADVQDYATLYRTSLDTSIARSNQLQKTQELQINQQQADTQQWDASERAQANLRQSLNESVANMPANFGGTANLSGPQGRFAALAAAGAFGGEQAARGLAQASSWGTTELNGINAGLRAFQDNLKRMQGAGPQGGIRGAPTIGAPPPIGVNFTPPGSVRFPTATTAPMSEIAPVRQNPEGMDAPAPSTQEMMGSAFVPPGSPLTEEQRRLGLRNIGGV